MVRPVVGTSHRLSNEKRKHKGGHMDRRHFSPAPRRSRPAARKPAIAQGATEVSFFYPIAVGGPITKIIDGYAADFEKENPAIKVKPIYAGTYQETHRQGAHRAQERHAAVTSVLLSTDMFTLIDEDAIVPSTASQDRRGQEVARELLPRLHAQQPGRRQRPGACRSSARPSCSTGTRSCSGRPASIPRGPDTWADQVAFAEKLTKRDGSGNVTQWGVQVPSSGFPYWLFQGFTTPAGAILMNPEGDRTSMTSRRSSRRCNTGSTCRASTRSTRPASSSGARRRRISSSARRR
jgi:sn-glycerol 3-phosphate transport system substrate-binding protein